MKIPPGTESVNKCVLCTESVVVIDLGFAKHLGLIGPYQVKCCSKCGLRWLSPRPDQEAYQGVYSEQNYFGGDKAVEDYSSLATERRPCFRARLLRIMRCFPRQRAFSILDVGAATGEFVFEARELGHHADGIEFSAAAAKKAKEQFNLTLFVGSLDSYQPSKPYDVIHMNHVFEHLPWPLEILAACRRMLASKGVLVLEVPLQFYNDLDRLKRSLFLSKKPRFNAYSLHHAYFYTPDTLTKLLVKQGFDIELSRTANPDRTPLHPFSFKNLFLRYFLWAADALHKGGNIIEVYARKP